MAKREPARKKAPVAAFVPEQAPRGSVRPCVLYAGEVLRHRIITADGHDFAVATSPRSERKAPFVTAAYPVQHGYLVMVRQPLCTLRAEDEATARENHEKLVRVLAEAGVGVVRARRALAARQRAEHRPGSDDSGTMLLAWPQSNTQSHAAVEIDLA